MEGDPIMITSLETPPKAPSRRRRRSILGVGFDFIDYAAALDTIDRWREQGTRQYITITNPHAVRTCTLDPHFRQITARSGLTLPDGAGIVLAANIFRYRNHGRVTGPTLMLKACDWGRMHNYRHFFYGGAEGVAKTLATRLGEKYPGLQVAGTYCPPFRQLTRQEDEDIIAMINQTHPDIVWVGLGAPKQEKWAREHLGRINATVMIGVGAAFDFHSGNVKWAPAWIRNIGAEWAWRLVLEPRRMWRRNIDSIVFLLQVILRRLRLALVRQR